MYISIAFKTILSISSFSKLNWALNIKCKVRPFHLILFLIFSFYSILYSFRTGSEKKREREMEWNAEKVSKSYTRPTVNMPVIWFHMHLVLKLRKKLLNRNAMPDAIIVVGAMVVERTSDNDGRDWLCRNVCLTTMENCSFNWNWKSASHLQNFISLLN